MPVASLPNKKKPERFPVPAFVSLLNFSFLLSAFHHLSFSPRLLEPGMDQALWPVLPPSARARTCCTVPVVRPVRVEETIRLRAGSIYSLPNGASRRSLNIY